MRPLRANTSRQRELEHPVGVVDHRRQAHAAESKNNTPYPRARRASSIAVRRWASSTRESGIGPTNTTPGKPAGPDAEILVDDLDAENRREERGVLEHVAPRHSHAPQRLGATKSREVATTHVDALNAHGRERRLERRSGEGNALSAVEPLVLVRHLHDLLSRVLADEVGMVGRDVSLDVLDQCVVGFAFNVRAARAVNNLHVSLLVVGRT